MRAASLLSGVTVVLAGCAPLRPGPVPPPMPQPASSRVLAPVLPALPVQTLIVDSTETPVQGNRGRITLTSSNAELRSLLPLLANAAGVSLVLGPEVRGRVSVRFQNVPAIDALMAVIEQAGLTVGSPGPQLPWEKPVFYDLPVNINDASAATLKTRFNLTQPLADFIVRARTF